MSLDELAPVITVDEVAELMRWDRGDVRERRRRVYALVRAGRLTPIGGAPQRCSTALRFSGRQVAELISGAVA